jgi:hypothetical protein
MANATAAAPAAKKNGANAVGLFPVAYQIGGNVIDAPKFIVHLLVNTPNERITGYGNITQGVNPPLNLETKLEGNYTYMTVVGSSSILVVATGYPVINWPPNGGVGPVLMPNVELRMVLSDDWAGGTANYRYTDSNGQWHDVTNAPVKKI